MIDNKSFELYTQLVKDNHFKDMFDLGIIYQVVSTIQANDLEIKFEDSQDFKSLCNEVKRQYLKYDKDLNDDLVLEVMKEMGFINE